MVALDILWISSWYTVDYSSYLDTRGAIFLTIFVRMYADQDYVVYIDVWIKTFAVQVGF